MQPVPIRYRRQRTYEKVLFSSLEARPGSVLLWRLGMLLLLFCGVVFVLWLDRGGLRDAVDGELSLIDLVYFAVVSLTTTGYGDIVPVTERARLIDTVLITPVRVVVWLLFIGTAYDLFFSKGLERIRMARIQAHLANHTVICGFGHSGRTAAAELGLRGAKPESIVVVDIDDQLLHEAAECGYIGIRGDATLEKTLQDARIGAAQAAIVSMGRDDTTVLAVLTIRKLAPGIRVIASVRENENVSLIEQAGADVTVTPSQVSGYLLADSVQHQHVNSLVLDMVSTGGRLLLCERPAEPVDVGQRLGVIGDQLAVRLLRGGRMIGFWEQDATIQAGDTLLVLRQTEPKRD